MAQLSGLAAYIREYIATNDMESFGSLLSMTRYVEKGMRASVDERRKQVTARIIEINREAVAKEAAKKANEEGLWLVDEVDVKLQACQHDTERVSKLKEQIRKATGKRASGYSERVSPELVARLTTDVKAALRARQATQQPKKRKEAEAVTGELVGKMRTVSTEALRMADKNGAWPANALPENDTRYDCCYFLDSRNVARVARRAKCWGCGCKLSTFVGDDGAKSILCESQQEGIEESQQ